MNTQFVQLNECWIVQYVFSRNVSEYSEITWWISCHYKWHHCRGHSIKYRIILSCKKWIVYKTLIWDLSTTGICYGIGIMYVPKNIMSNSTIPVVLNCCSELVSTGIDISLDINDSCTICDGCTVVDSVWKIYLVVAKCSSDTTMWQPPNAQRHIMNMFTDRQNVCMLCWPKFFSGC